MMAFQIKEKMHVVGSDGDYVGTVETIDGEHISLADEKSGLPGFHRINVDQVEIVDAGVVSLLVSAAQAKAGWASALEPAQ